MNRIDRLKALRVDVDALAKAEEGDLLAGLPQWDSLAILLVISHFEHVHGIEIKGNQVRACRTVADVLNLNTPLQ
jgi:acyl carrier protein